MKILIIDDDALMRSVITKALKSANHEVEESSDGQEAIHLLANNFYDAVITDIVMPGVSGISVGEFIKEHNIPLGVLAISAHGGEGGMLDFANYFADDTLQKPFTKEQLLSAVQRLPSGINMESALQNL